MPIPVVCASCQTKLVAPDAAAGKRVKCKICQAAIVVPTPVVEEASDFAFGDPVNPVKAQPKTVKLDDDRPRKKSKVVVDDEDEIDPPRKRTKRKQVAKANPLKFVLLGLVGLMAVGVVGAVAWYATSQEVKVAGTSPIIEVGRPTDTATKAVPAGWSEYDPLPSFTLYFKDSLGVVKTRLSKRAGFDVIALTVSDDPDATNGMQMTITQFTPEFFAIARVNAEEFLNDEKVNLGRGREISTDKKITVDGHPGREFKVREKSGVEGFMRFVLAYNRLYIYRINEPGISEQSENYKTFFDNVKLKP